MPFLSSFKANNVYHDGFLSWRFNIFFLWAWTSGSNREEIQSLTYDYEQNKDSKKDEFSRIDKQNVGNLDLNSLNLDSNGNESKLNQSVKSRCLGF